MQQGVHLLLMHEMPQERGAAGALERVDARNGCEFGDFFSHPLGATPSNLLSAGIYNELVTKAEALDPALGHIGLLSCSPTTPTHMRTALIHDPRPPPQAMTPAHDPCATKSEGARSSPPHALCRRRH